MNIKNRFVIAVALAMVLVLIAAGTWAAPKLAGTVPPVPETGGSEVDTSVSVPAVGAPACVGGPVDMRTAIFTPNETVCISVLNVADPATAYVAAPDGKTFVGDVFKVTAPSTDTIVQVCYAYPTELASKEAKIYKLNEEATPFVWIEVPGAVVADGTLCVSSAVGPTSNIGVFALIGNP